MTQSNEGRHVVKIDTSPENIRKAVIALLRQGVASKSKSGGCYYDHEGKCCVVGHMIPAQEDRQFLDYQGDASIAGLVEAQYVTLTTDSLDLLAMLQCIHDTSDACDWLGQFNKQLLKHGIEPIRKDEV